jgi:hypothetical protein
MTSVGRATVKVIVPVIMVYRNRSVIGVGAITVGVGPIGTPVRIVSTIVVVVIRAVVTISGMSATPVVTMVGFC